MAIVERSGNDKPKYWVEFAVLRLSRRELAGIASLMASDGSNLTKFELYSDIDNLLGGDNNWNDPVGNPHAASLKLDSRFGEI